MSPLKRALLALSVVLSCHVVVVELVSKDFIEKIEFYLKDRSSTVDIAVNMKNLERMYQYELKNSQSNLEFMKRLISLKENSCGLDYTNTLVELNIPFKGPIHTKDYRTLGRLEKVINELSIRHAKDCQSFYVQNYETKAVNLDSRKVSLVKTFANFMFRDQNKMNVEDVKSMQELFTKFIDNYYIIWNHKGKLVYQFLKSIMTKDLNLSNLKQADSIEEEDSSVEKEKLTKIYNEHVIEPCEHYVNELGPEIFKYVNYNYELAFVIDDSKREFYEAWARFNLCESLLKRKTLLLTRALGIVDQTQSEN